MNLMKKRQRNLLSMLLCIFTLICLVSTVAAAPSDLSSRDKEYVELCPLSSQSFPNQPLLEKYHQNDKKYKIFVNDNLENLVPNWRMVETFSRDPSLSEFLISIDHTGMNRDSIRPDDQVAETISHLGRNTAKLENLTSDVKNYLLTDFNYCCQNGSEIVVDMTVGELFESMETAFRVTGPSGSGYLNVFVRHSAIDDVGNFYRVCDLINMCHYLQKIASQNGYDGLGVLPVQFMDIDEDFATVTTAPSENGSMLRGAKDEYQRPLWGGLQISNMGNGHLYSMTSGFSVKFNGNQKHGIVTCGHMNPIGWNVYQPTMSSTNLIGTVKDRCLDGMDAAVIECTNSVTSEGKIHGGYSFAPGIDVNSYGDVVTSDNVRISGVKSGNKEFEYYTRANADVLDPTPEDQSECDNGVIHVNNAIILTGTTIEGDSGCPAYQIYDSFFGINKHRLVGTLSGSNSQSNIIVIQPILPVLDELGVTPITV